MKKPSPFFKQNEPVEVGQEKKRRDKQNNDYDANNQSPQQGNKVLGRPSSLLIDKMNKRVWLKLLGRPGSAGGMASNQSRTKMIRVPPTSSSGEASHNRDTD